MRWFTPDRSGELLFDRVADGTPGWRTLDLTTLAPQPVFQASATALEDAGFESARAVSVEVTLGGSGAIDDLRWISTR